MCKGEAHLELESDVRIPDFEEDLKERNQSEMGDP